VFVHINRTAGTSIETAFNGPRQDHRLASEYIREMGREHWDEHFSFSFVRNPWDRMVSLYHFNKMAYGEKRAFDEWLRQVLVKPNRFQGPQIDWLVDEDGEVAVDFVGRFEHLARDFSVVCGRVGANLKLPRLNISNHRHYLNYYDDEGRELVRRTCEKDIELFGYTFDEFLL
jgi:hypothetical protein